MTLKINPGSLPSIIHIPASKSYANRALILAALKHEPVILRHLPAATDVHLLKEALKLIGITFSEEGPALKVLNSFPACEKHGGEISVGEGGTTARFLASLLILGKASYTLVLGERLKDRPWEDFIQLVNSLGGKADLAGNKLTLQGPVKFPGNLEVDCSKTTQFASGLQLTTAFENTIIIPKNLKTSESYWNMTNQMIDQFQHQNEFTVPLDWSSASYPLAFGALKQEITFPGLKPDKLQADSKIFNLLSDLGMIKETTDGLKVKPHPDIHKDIHLEVSDCLDLVPTLGFLLSHIEGTHVLTGVENLAYKESDRLNEVIKLLDTFGFKASHENGSLIIEGTSHIHPPQVSLELPDDHRMVMAGALFLRFHQGGTISPEAAVNKSYPDFFKLIK